MWVKWIEDRDIVVTLSEDDVAYLQKAKPDGKPCLMWCSAPKIGGENFEAERSPFVGIAKETNEMDKSRGKEEDSNASTEV